MRFVSARLTGFGAAPLTSDCESGESGSPAPTTGRVLFGAAETPVGEIGVAAGRVDDGFAAAVRVSSAASESRCCADVGNAELGDAELGDAAALPLRRRSAVAATGLTSGRTLGSAGSAGRVDVTRARAAGRLLSPGGVVESVTAPYPSDYDP